MVSRQDIDPTSAHITVTIQREQIKNKLDAELKRIRQRAQIKGFRQGQAPMDYVKRMYGTSLFVDVFNDMLSEELYGYLREQDLDVLGQPLPTDNQRKYSFKIDQMEPEYSVEYEVGYVPKFELKGLDGAQTYEQWAVTDLDKLAEEDLENARNRMGKRSNPETDIQENDIVRIAARELDGNAVKDGGWETTITVFVKDVSDESFKKQLLAAKKGDTLRFNARGIESNGADDVHYRKYILNLPENDERAVGDLFEGAIEEVSRVEKAELDEAFFQGYFGGSVSDREGALDEIKKGIAQFYQVRAEALLMRDFQTRLLELNPIELPEAFLKRWLAFSNRDQLTTEQIEQEFPDFVQNLRWSLLRDKIKAEYEIEITEDDIKQEYLGKVRAYFRVDLPDELLMSTVERLMKNKEDVEKTQRDIESKKLFDVIREHVQVTDKPTTSEEFHKLLDSVMGR